MNDQDFAPDHAVVAFAARVLAGECARNPGGLDEDAVRAALGRFPRPVRSEAVRLAGRARAVLVVRRHYAGGERPEWVCFPPRLGQLAEIGGGS